MDEARAKIWLVDSKGLVTKSRYDSLTAVKKPFAKEHEEKKDLLGTVQSLKPTVIIGTSAQPHTFTKEVMETMASYCKVQSTPPPLPLDTTTGLVVWVPAPADGMGGWGRGWGMGWLASDNFCPLESYFEMRVHGRGGVCGD